MLNLYTLRLLCFFFYGNTIFLLKIFLDKRHMNVNSTLIDLFLNLKIYLKERLQFLLNFHQEGEQRLDFNKKMFCIQLCFINNIHYQYFRTTTLGKSLHCWIPPNFHCVRHTNSEQCHLTVTYEQMRTSASPKLIKPLNKVNLSQWESRVLCRPLHQEYKGMTY